MKKTLILVLSIFVVASSGRCAESLLPLTVAVYDFTASGPNLAHIGTKVTALVTADLTTETNLVLLERAELTKALNEQAFGISGMVSSGAAAKIGQLTGAKVLVAGQVIAGQGARVVIVANIVGTETGRLFAAKVEGSGDNLLELTSQLSAKIAQTVTEQAANLVGVAGESHTAHIERILQAIHGTNRPSVSISIIGNGKKKPHSGTAEGEFGAVLLKAGFRVVDNRSDRKPDVEISGTFDLGTTSSRGSLVTCRAVIDLKVQERRSGNIITYDRGESVVTDSSKVGADRTAQVDAVDKIAERLLPLLAK